MPNYEELKAKAMEIAQKDDIIILAGKGHETYQIIGTEKRHFDEKEIIARSEMGFLLDGDKDLKSGFALNNVDINSFASTWKPVLGQYAEIEDKYNQCLVSLTQISTGRTMRIVFDTTKEE